MKKLLIAALLVVGMTSFAQEQKKPIQDKPQRERLSPEQRNELMLKKMTLELGLNEGQQKDMAKIIAEQTTKREAAMAEMKANKEKGIKPTADERFARESKRLDEQIVLKEKVKKILTPDQFKKWEEMRAQHKERRHDRAEKRGGRMPKAE